MLCLGEAAAMSGEAASRADLGLPGRQRALAEAIFDLGKPVVVLLSSGRPLALPWLFERADAVLATWFLGGEAGHAVADVLTGQFNPTGRLPVSWPRSVGQVPIFYRQRPTGRPTKARRALLELISRHAGDAAISVWPRPLLQPLCAPRSRMRSELGQGRRIVEVSVTVANDSEVDGEATLFLFVHDLVASVARPVLELKGVRKIVLRGREQRPCDVAAADRRPVVPWPESRSRPRAGAV